MWNHQAEAEVLNLDRLLFRLKDAVAECWDVERVVVRTRTSSLLSRCHHCLLQRHHSRPFLLLAFSNGGNALKRQHTLRMCFSLRLGLGWDWVPAMSYVDQEGRMPLRAQSAEGKFRMG